MSISSRQNASGTPIRRRVVRLGTLRSLCGCVPVVDHSRTLKGGRPTAHPDGLDQASEGELDPVGGIEAVAITGVRT